MTEEADLEAAEIPADAVEVLADKETAGDLKCIRQSALNAATRVKYLLNQPVTSQFIAKAVLKRKAMSAPEDPKTEILADPPCSEAGQVLEIIKCTRQLVINAANAVKSLSVLLKENRFTVMNVLAKAVKADPKVPILINFKL
jgi:hypothetical protein